jgi:putative methionine-R-sulfoxide reductase with GAF domain
VAWAGIAFFEDGKLVLGPAAGEPHEIRRTRVPIAFRGEPVGELWVDGEADRGTLEQVADRLAAHVLIGWDTRGEQWEP